MTFWLFVTVIQHIQSLPSLDMGMSSEVPHEEMICITQTSIFPESLISSCMLLLPQEYLVFPQDYSALQVLGVLPFLISY